MCCKVMQMLVVVDWKKPSSLNQQEVKEMRALDRGKIYNILINQST